MVLFVNKSDIFVFVEFVTLDIHLTFKTLVSACVCVCLGYLSVFSQPPIYSDSLGFQCILPVHWISWVILKRRPFILFNDAITKVSCLLH